MKQPILGILVAIMIIAITVVVIFARVPEQVSMVSLDEVVTITGVARESQPIEIVATTAAGGDTLVGPVYEITPAEVELEVPAQLEFDLSGRDEAESLLVYRYDSEFDLWQPVDIASRTADQHIVIETTSLGRFSFGQAHDLAAPNFLSVYDELLERAPDGTVGAIMIAGYRFDDGPWIELPDSERLGGCAGLLESGNRTEYSRVEQELRVLVDDVETLVEFNFKAKWLVSDLDSCPEEKPLEIQDQM